MSRVKKSPWLVITILMSSIAFASNFSAEFHPGQQTITSDETAEFNATILHNFPGTELFQIYSPEVLWDIRTKDALQVSPGTPFKTTLTVKPLNINPGLYGIPLHVKRVGSNEVKRALIYLEVSGPPALTKYLPAVKGTAEIPAFIDPREEVPITVHLENQNRRNLTTINIKVRSNVVNHDYETTLGPLERKTVKFTTRIDPKTTPQSDEIKVYVIVPEKDKGFQFDLPPVEYQVQAYGQITPSIQETKYWLKTDRLITLTNNANTLIKEPYAFPVPWYARLFTTTEPETARVENNALVWDIALNTGNSTELRVTTNYRPLAAAIMLGIIMLVLYYVFRSPLKIKKSAIITSTREGGISELKILLELHNRSKKPLNGLTIIDLVPRIAEVSKEHELGTLAPTKILRHDKKGTILKYEVGDLQPYEERVIAYKIKSSLSILGGLSLPTATGRFKTATGKEITTSSNEPKITLTM